MESKQSRPQPPIESSSATSLEVQSPSDWEPKDSTPKTPRSEGRRHTPETKAKISEAKKGEKNPNYGKKLSPEHRAKLSEAHKGKKLSPEHRAKLSEAHKGKKLSPEHRDKLSKANKGKKLSPETKAKMSAAHKGKKLSLEHRAKMSQAQKGRKLSSEHRAKISQANKGKKLSPETKAKISEAKKAQRGPRYDQNIEQIRLAIADCVLGESMVQAGLNQGFSGTWLARWSYKHPQKFQDLYLEVATELTQTTINQATIGSHALDLTVEEFGQQLGLEPDWLDPSTHQELDQKDQAALISKLKGFLAKNYQPPQIEIKKLQPQNNNYDHSYDTVAYPEDTPMMEVTMTRKRQIVVAAIAIDFDPDYHQQAECRGANTNLFFPTKGDSKLAGKEICGGCEVRWHCLEEGLTDENQGIWGGVSNSERRRITSKRKKLANENGQTLEKGQSHQISHKPTTGFKEVRLYK